MLTADTITDDKIEVLPFPDDPSVWSVSVTLSDGTYVGVAVHDEALIPSAKEHVRTRCVQILNDVKTVTQVLAPCGHPGTPVVGSYVSCPRCDAMPDRDQIDPSRYIMCPACKTLDVVQLAARNNAPWWKCNKCKLEFEPTRGNQP